MTQVQPGWFPDPHPQAPPGAQRYWDGQQWTEHVNVPGPGLPPAYAPQTERVVTPDGVPLAGWWQRVGAYVIDGIITFVVGMVLSAPFLPEIADAFGDYFEAAFDAASAGEPGPSSLSMYDGHVGAFVAQALISLAVIFGYHAVCLRRRSATLGMSAVGIAVRRREQPGPLEWGTVGKRVGAQFGPFVISAVPMVGALAGLYLLLDDLWPLWDGRRQALHDKAADTCVVRTR